MLSIPFFLIVQQIGPRHKKAQLRPQKESFLQQCLSANVLRKSTARKL